MALEGAMKPIRRTPVLQTIALILCALASLFLWRTAAAGKGWSDITKGAQDILRGATGTQGGLSNDEVIRGLKEALSLGTNHSVSSASRVGGYYDNSLIRIPFPPEAQKVKTVAETIGMRKQVDDFVRTLNRAAEEAAKEAAPIFLSAITQMTIQDGFQILRGPDDAATSYLRRTTTAPLTQKFRPIVRQAIEKVQVTKYWNPIAQAYNQIPLVKPVNPDLDAYVTEKGLQGLFTLIAQEERKIRHDPAARVTDLLRKVFGST
jgi:Protein of unknown function (DUF4197)